MPKSETRGRLMLNVGDDLLVFSVEMLNVEMAGIGFFHRKKKTKHRLRMILKATQEV